MSKYDTMVEPRLNEIRKWASDGATEQEIAKALGIGYATFRRYKKDSDQLNGILTENRAAADERALGAFYRRVVGTVITEEVSEIIDGELVVVKRTAKEIPPDVQAGQFWLANRMPEMWRNRQSIEADITTRKLEDFLD